MNNKPKVRTSNLVVQESEKELLIYDLNENKALCLNETCARVWRLCDGNRTVDEIASEIGARLGSTVNPEIVLLALDQMKKENLLRNLEQLSEFSKGLSRREAFRRVGLGSAIALPIISSIVSPTVTAAQSVFVQTCSSVGCECDVSDPNSCDLGLTCNSQAPPVFIGATEVGICTV